MSSVLEYFEALDRLVKHTPIRVAPGTKITKDAVALEAGRKKGAIKKSRATFQTLIKSIYEASQKQNKVGIDDKERSNRYRCMYEDYRNRYEKTIARESMLVYRIYELEKQLLMLREGK